MNHSLLPSFKKAVCILPFFACLLFSSQLLAQKNAPVAGDAALLTDLLKKDYNTLDPDARREQLAKDRTIVIGTLKRYLTDEQQINIKSNPNEKVESCFMEYKKAEQELTLYNTKVSKGEAEINKINQLITDSEGNKKEYYEKRYTSDIASFKKLIDVFKTENQYLCYVSDAFHTKYEALQQFQDDQYAEASQESSIQKTLPFIGGDLAFEVIIDGLSKFLAERIKEELTVAVIERVQDYLRNPKENDPLAELKVLLPRTQQYLLSFKASQMVNFPDEIKQYIEDDLKHLPENLGDLGNTPRIRRLVEQYPELDFALEALEFIPNLSKIKNPVDFFDLLENSRNISRWANEVDPVKHNLANTLKLASLLAHSFTVVDNSELRIAGADFLNAYGSEVPFYMLYVGFLHQQNSKYYDITFNASKNILVGTKNPLNGAISVETKNKILLSECTKGLMENFNENDLTSLKENIDFFAELFSQIGGKAEKIYVSTQMIRKARKNGTDIGADTIYTYIDDIISLTEEITGTTDTLIAFLFSHTGSYIYAKKKVDSLDPYAFELWAEKNNVFIPSRKKMSEYFDLKDRLSPYLSIARKTNELVYDLQQKKYATAMIKALEITTDLWPNQLQQQPKYLQGTLTLFPHKGGANGSMNWRKELRKKWHAKSWSKVLSAKKVKRRFAKVAMKEIDSIKNYYTYYYFDRNAVLLNELETIYTELNFSKKKKKITPINCSDELKILMLSYYSKQKLTDYDSSLINEMKSFTINEKRKQRPLFETSAESDTLITDFHTYYLAYFQYLLDRDKKKIKNANEVFREDIENLLFKIPENHSFQLNPQTIQIIHFINDMAKAENSDDVKDAIQAFALPAGSYSLKRQQKFTFSVNSYPGVLASIESTWTNNKPYNTFSPSFTAPVGLNLCWSAPRGMSHSIFVPVIDVGAFTRMYIGGKSIDTTSSTTDSVYFATLPEFSFMNLFSPGIYYALGFRKRPLSLYAGAQWGPYLREVKKEEGEIKTINNYNSFRFSIGLVLDIPLWNIHSKSRL
jgi:hypothetical protein